MMSLGLVYEGVAFLCCRGVVVAAPVGWYPTPVPVAWGVERVVRGARLGAGCRELGRGGLRGDFVVFNCVLEPGGRMCRWCVSPRGV